MTSRYAGLVVTFEADIRSDDAEAWIAAISLFRGVASVKALQATPEVHLASERAKNEMRQRIMDVLWSKEAP